MFKKTIIIALITAICLAAIPFGGISAAGITSKTTPPTTDERLEQAWSKVQTAYQNQGDRLATADEFLDNAQALIDKAAQNGRDTSSLQAALDAFSAVIPAAQAAHCPGATIIASHTGFSKDGKVTDNAAALVTVKALGTVLKNTHAAMDGTGQTLRDAVKAFRKAH